MIVILQKLVFISAATRKVAGILVQSDHADGEACRAQEPPPWLIIILKPLCEDTWLGLRLAPEPG